MFSLECVSGIILFVFYYSKIKKLKILQTFVLLIHILTPLQGYSTTIIELILIIF